jgi:segregation and condensation protein B
MSDEPQPPDEGDEDGQTPEGHPPDEGRQSDEGGSSQFFDDGLEEPVSLHAAAGRLRELMTENSDQDVETNDEAPVGFPLPIELGTFHGVLEGGGEGTENTPPPTLSVLSGEDKSTSDTIDDIDNVISLLPRVTGPGSIWELKPAGEETSRDSYDENEELTAPEPHMVEGTVEAILFATDQPLTDKQINSYLANPGISIIRDCLLRIQSRFRRPGSGIRLVEVAKGWQLRTDMRAARYVAAMRGEKPLKLSKAALDTLAIVAYRQPVTRAEVEDLRGVDPGGILRMLTERSLISVTGRKDEPGRPLLYGTTPDFLSMFGLRDLSDLPTLRDLRELQRDDAREGIGSTDEDLLSNDFIDSESVGTLEPVQEPLPIEPREPID